MNNLLISLVIATYGRSQELDTLLSSLVRQNIDKDKFEVILIDQNVDINLTSLLKKYENLLNIVHHRSSITGLSYNRNIGLRMSRGAYVCFPDDDCSYYPDTLSVALEILSKNDIDVCLGRIFDRHKCINVLKDWPILSKFVGKFDFFRLTSSITIFCKKDYQIEFDEKLGAGTYFGSCEDADYLWRFLNNGKKVFYNPDLQVNHPPQSSISVPQKKFESYQRGFGAFLRKNFTFPIFYLMIIAFGYYFFQAIKHLVCLEFYFFRRRVIGIISVTKGIYEYNNK